MLYCDCDIAKYVLFEACNAIVNLEKREIDRRGVTSLDIKEPWEFKRYDP